MNSPTTAQALEEALRAELRSGPSAAAIITIDRRVRIALDAPGRPSGGATGWLRQLTVAPLAAILAALVLGTVVVAAALVLTAEDQRVVDLTACMRAHGWQVADPNTGNGMGHVVPGFSSIVDGADQQAFNADLEACATEAGIPVDR